MHDLAVAAHCRSDFIELMEITEVRGEEGGRLLLQQLHVGAAGMTYCVHIASCS